MKRTLLSALHCSAACLALLLCGCGAQSLAPYADQKPALDLRAYFNGTLDAYGLFTDRSGQVVKRFEVLLACHWEGNEGTLDESFRYADGTTQKRVWHLTRRDDKHYLGRADDVDGVALGELSGNTLHWNYSLLLPVDGSIYRVQFDDWMYLMNDKVMLNKASMSKWGVHLGDVTLSFAKH